MGNPNEFSRKALSQPIPAMTLRDWFAGQTLAGMLAHPQADYAPWGDASSGIAGTDMLAREAYRLADAMLTERTKPHAE